MPTYRALDEQGVAVIEGSREEVETIAAGIEGVRVVPHATREELEERIEKLQQLIFEASRIAVS